MQEWVATASLFSGRPDPTWHVSQDKAEALVLLWEHLHPFTNRPVPAPKPLGYRGSVLTASDGRRYSAYGGVVACHTGQMTEYRDDDEGQFERQLLATAPEGLLPANIPGVGNARGR